MSAMVQIFSEVKMKFSIQRGEAELNGTSFTEWKHLFHCTNEKTCIICFKQILKKKTLKNDFSSSKMLNKQRVLLYAGSITRTLGSR